MGRTSAAGGPCRTRHRRRIAAFALAVCTSASSASSASSSIDADRLVPGLVAHERALRPVVQARLVAGERADHGSDPVALAVGADGTIAVALAGRGHLALLSSSSSSSTVPIAGFASVDDVAVLDDGFVAVSRTSDRVAVVREGVAGLRRVSGVSGLAAVAVVGRRVFVVDARDGEDGDGDVLELALDGDYARVVLRTPLAPFVRALRAVPTPQGVVVVGLSGPLRRLVVSPVDDTLAAEARPGAAVDFEGAVFGLAARADNEGLVEVAIGATEDHPLERRGGSFGFIDSVLHRLVVTPAGVERRVMVNLSEHDVVTPKALAFDGDDVVVFGSGSGRGARVDAWGVLREESGVIGARDVVVAGRRTIAASPLLDTVVVREGGARRTIAVDDVAPRGARTASERLGEALVFTTAMAPQQSSTAALSRFTCEACHPDGGVDGRTHATGRTDEQAHSVTATTKPLFGLFQNPPLFTRAYDDTVGVMVNAEFRVANARSPRDPLAPLVVSDDAPFLRELVPGLPAVVAPEVLRTAVIDFLAGFDPPRAPPRPVDDDARAGLAVFRARCLSCHAARVFADDAASAVEVDDARLWQFLARGTLVWGSEVRQDVGVWPLVREGGGRSSSLRGVARKAPLLTNGSAATLEAFVARLRVDDTTVWHDGAPREAAPLAPAEQRALLSFLRRL